MNVRAWFATWQERIDALTLRERVLLFAAIVAVTYGLVVAVAIHPLEVRAQTVKTDLAEARVQTAAVSTQLDTLLAPSTRAREHAELKTMSHKIRVLKRRLAHLAGALVPAREMPALLREVLARTPGVTLVALTDQGTTAMRRSPKAKPFLYRHEMVLVVRGSYRALVRYLTALAHTKKRVLWGRVTLTADHYPFSTLRLHVYTLSSHEALLE
ncbi:MAG: hypothetical protein ACYCTF_13080 [Acidiferrobacter sp.]